MSVRHLLTATAAAVLGGLVLATPAAAQVSVAADEGGSGRGGAMVAMVIALISVIIGGVALAQSAGRIGTGNGRGGAMVAPVVALIGMVVGVMQLTGSDGGVGSGNGRGGAVVALVIALIAIVLSGMVLSRTRRTS
ncbi:DUF6223 family protein [Streptomyces sp. NPDC051214]|uniref:DUF6223 family protein n=1 Tax=Streptomyces sp. NPDC051214 TaxID=3155282 RepID=UPI0034210182